MAYGTWYTYSSTIKNLSPSDAIHFPRKLSVFPFIKIGCWLPLRNHEPSQRCGNVQFDTITMHHDETRGQNEEKREWEEREEEKKTYIFNTIYWHLSQIEYCKRDSWIACICFPNVCVCSGAHSWFYTFDPFRVRYFILLL